MPGRRRSARRGTRPRRRRGFWVDTLISQDVGDGTTDTKDLLLTPSQFDKYGLTVDRTIVRLKLRPNAVFVTIGLQALDLGIGVFEQDSFAANALPDLNFADDQPGRGWLWRDRYMVEDHSTAGAVEVSTNVYMDLRGKRRIDDMELALLMTNNTAQGTAFSVLVEGLIRCHILR